MLKCTHVHQRAETDCASIACGAQAYDEILRGALEWQRWLGRSKMGRLGLISY